MEAALALSLGSHAWSCESHAAVTLQRCPHLATYPADLALAGRHDLLALDLLHHHKVPLQSPICG